MSITRRVNKNQTVSYWITLPKKWVDEVVKREGRELRKVKVDENDGGLTVKPIFEE